MQSHFHKFKTKNLKKKTVMMVLFNHPSSYLSAFPPQFVICTSVGWVSYFTETNSRVCISEILSICYQLQSVPITQVPGSKQSVYQGSIHICKAPGRNKFLVYLQVLLLSAKDHTAFWKTKHSQKGAFCSPKCMPRIVFACFPLIPGGYLLRIMGEKEVKKFLPGALCQLMNVLGAGHSQNKYPLAPPWGMLILGIPFLLLGCCPAPAHPTLFCSLYQPSWDCFYPHHQCFLTQFITSFYIQAHNLLKH